MRYNSDSPTSRICDSTYYGKIVSFRNITFIKQVQSNVPPSMVVDTDGGSKNSDDFQNLYHGMKNLESAGLDNVGSNNNI